MELADMLLSSGEDARTGPGARTIAVVLGLVACARGMRPLGEDAEGDGGQDGRARGRADAASHVCSRLRVPGKYALSLVALW